MTEADVERKRLSKILKARFSDMPTLPADFPANSLLTSIAGRGSCRSYTGQEVPFSWLHALSSIALSSPTKSDLQQRDIIIVQDAAKRAGLARTMSGQSWIAAAPALIVFCGNNRRQRLLHEWHDMTFANDHLDAFFNATADAAIALSTFVTAAETVGLGCCPISAIRNQAQAVSDLLGLPDHVFPMAGLAVGFPSKPREVSKRLPLHVTVHSDAYGEDDLDQAVSTYDAERAIAQPYEKQRYEDAFGTSQNYCWSQDKVRQYSRPERSDFGDFIRSKGFDLK